MFPMCVTWLLLSLRPALVWLIRPVSLHWRTATLPSRSYRLWMATCLLVGCCAHAPSSLLGSCLARASTGLVHSFSFRKCVGINSVVSWKCPFLKIVNPLWLLQSLFFLFFIDPSLMERGVIKTFHLGLRVSKVLTLCMLFGCRSLC